MFKVLRHIIGLVLSVLITGLGAMTMPMTPAASHQAEFFPHQPTALAEHSDVHFTVRAPPTTVANVAVTGAAVVGYGDGIVMHEHQPHVASLGFGVGLEAPNRAGGTADAVAGAKLNRDLLLDEVVDHSFYKHVLQQGEFKGLGIRTKAQFREHVNNVIENPSGIRYYKDGRSVYLQESTGTLVVRNPTGSGQSTAFQPENWNDYITNKLPTRATPYQ